ncbi:cupin domain-containing protein [soil metagenome]
MTVRGPHKGTLTGAPVESVHVLHSDTGGRSGIWECTPGSFASTRNGDTELMHFLSGAGTITAADGTVHDIRPGVVLVAPDGWRGTWDIRETVRKVYTIWSSAH